MKKKLIALIVSSTFVLSGCMQQYEPSEQQTDIIAESIAGMLLKYDKNYRTTLLSSDVMAKIDDYVNNLTSDNDSEINVDLGDTTSADKDSTYDRPADNVSEDKPSSGTSTTYYSLSNVIGIEGLEFTYKGYELYDEYPNQPDLYYSLTHKEGNQFLVVSLVVHNTSNEKKGLDLSTADIKSTLDVNEDTIYKPVLTLLEEDLQFINVVLASDEEKTALLIFEVPKKSEVSDVNLKISQGDKSIDIDLDRDIDMN